MAAKPLPSQEVLRQLLDYDEKSGSLTWKERPTSWFEDTKQTKEHNARIWNGKNVGKPALHTKLPRGYRYGSIQKTKVLAHRVIWKMMTGDDPDVIDHIDGNPSNNRWVNLRSVSFAENTRNIRRRKSASGIQGVRFDARINRWIASINPNYRKIHVGCFITKEEAIAARKAAEAEHGFHENHGRAA